MTTAEKVQIGAAHVVALRLDVPLNKAGSRFGKLAGVRQWTTSPASDCWATWSEGRRLRPERELSKTTKCRGSTGSKTTG